MPIGDDGPYDEQRVAAILSRWGLIRGAVEESGDVERADWAEVLDLERAIEALASKHIPAAGVLALVAWGFNLGEVAFIVGRRPHTRKGEVSKFYRQGLAWCTAYLSGEDPEDAWKNVP